MVLWIQSPWRLRIQDEYESRLSFTSPHEIFCCSPAATDTAANFTMAPQAVFCFSSLATVYMWTLEILYMVSVRSLLIKTWFLQGDLNHIYWWCSGRPQLWLCFLFTELRYQNQNKHWCLYSAPASEKTTTCGLFGASLFVLTASTRRLVPKGGLAFMLTPIKGSWPTVHDPTTADMPSVSTLR